MPTQASWKIGDAVRLCVQAPEFERLQTSQFGGWCSDMIKACGRTGLITECLTSPLRFRVKLEEFRSLVINPAALAHVEAKTRKRQEDEETSKSALAVLPKIFKSVFTWDFVKEIVQDKVKDVAINAILAPFGIHGPVKTIVIEVIKGVCHIYYSAVVEKKSINRSFLSATVKDVFGGVVKKLGMDVVIGDVFGKVVLEDLDELSDVVEAATNVAEEEEKKEKEAKAEAAKRDREEKEKKSAGGFHVGDHVRAKYPNGREYPAQIAQLHANNTMLLNWDDKDTKHREVSFADVKAVSKCYGGYHYKVLDATCRDEKDRGTQSDYKGLPSGWSLAPDEQGIRQHVIGKHTWGTDVVVVDGGRGYATPLYTSHSAGPGTLWRSDLLQTLNGSWKPSQASLRILIRQRA